ncbi:MAG TPA: aminoglycoside phosphotransferase family protein [Pseudonocardiaceae bacterium]|jgi:streptomycin 6-kinase
MRKPKSSLGDHPELTDRLVRRFGPGVRPWAAGLPELADRLATRWALTLGEPFADGASSVALRVTTAAGAGAVLKLSPDLPFLAEQITVLRLFGSSGRVPAVLAEDRELGAVLMAEIRPGTTVRTMAAAPEPAAYAGLLTALHAVALPPVEVVSRDVRPTMDGFLAGARDRRTEPELAPHLREADFDRATAELDRLLAGPAPTALVHGDLHLGNVLDGGATGLCAIDPKACRGDPCFDAADYVAAGAGHDGELHRRLAGLADAGYDPGRVLGWCRAGAPALAVPLLRSGNVRAATELLALVR